MGAGEEADATFTQGLKPRFGNTGDCVIETVEKNNHARVSRSFGESDSAVKVGLIRCSGEEQAELFAAEFHVRSVGEETAKCQMRGRFSRWT